MDRVSGYLIGGLGAAVLFLAGITFQHSSNMDDALQMKLDILTGKVSTLEARIEVQQVLIDDLKARLDNKR